MWTASPTSETSRISAGGVSIGVGARNAVSNARVPTHIDVHRAGTHSVRPTTAPTHICLGPQIPDVATPGVLARHMGVNLGPILRIEGAQHPGTPSRRSVGAEFRVN